MKTSIKKLKKSIFLFELSAIFRTFASRKFGDKITDMARVCQVTGKKPMGGHTVSHSNIKTKRRFLPNLKTKRFYFAEEERWITLKVSTDALRTINKNGLAAVIKGMRADGVKI